VGRLRRWLIVLMVISWPALAVAASRFVPDVSILEDPSGDMSLDEVMRVPERFVPSVSPRPNFGYSRSAYWLRVRYTLPDDGLWLLELGYSQIDDVRVHLPAADGFVEHVTGDRHAVRSRQRTHPHFVFELPRSRRHETLYLRARSEGSMLLPIKLWRSDAFAEHALRDGLLNGFYYAFLIALALYNLFLFFAVRDRSYLLYVGYLSCFALGQAALGGEAALYLWPDAPAWGSVAGITFTCLGVASALLFVREMTQLQELAAGLSRLMVVLAAMAVGCLPLLYVSYPVGVRIATGVCVASSLLVVVPLVVSLRRGNRPARFMLLAYAAILPGALMFGLRHFELVPSTVLTERAMQIGTALEALLLSFALADRIHVLRHDGERAQRAQLVAEKAALSAQRSLSQGLIGAQDAERKRIAAELHDGVGQDMLVLVNELRRAAKSSAPLNRLGDIAGDTVDALRAVARRLHPHQLDRLGLGRAVQSAAEETLRGRDVVVETNIGDVDGALPKAHELHVYRIAQEALSNAARHADATCVHVALVRDGEELLLTVEDDGGGVDQARLNEGAGLGLASMRERACVCGGSLEVTMERGVRIRLRVPLEAAP
jgi:signal transduction histidine kinase